MVNINLWAKEGYFSVPDGNNIYFWGFSKTEDGPAQLPGPNIIAKEGDQVTVNLTNNLSERVSIFFPGQEKVEVEGQIVQPQYDSENNLISFINFVEPGMTISYNFTATHAGTFIYESGTNPHKQVQMGLYGGLVIRPADFDEENSKTAYGIGTDTEFDREYLLIVSEIDPKLHKAVEEGKPYNISEYLPRYWTMNGRCAPDTNLKSNAPFLPNQPYGSRIMLQPNDKVLIRYIDAGFHTHPLHPHGNHTRVIALDGRLLRNGNIDRSYERFTVNVCPGQTYDQIYTWTGLGYTPENPIPTVLPNLRNMAVGFMWSGSPYLGEKGEMPQDITSFNQNGEYHFMIHSHSEVEITNWGGYPGGMMTMVAIYPSLSEEVGVLK